MDVYFSADVETDGPIPGRFSMLSFGMVGAGTFDGIRFERPQNYEATFYRELRPISDEFQDEALQINGLDRDRLGRHSTTRVALTSRQHSPSRQNSQSLPLEDPNSLTY